jgi:two-component system, cell cycle response regulator DivK
VQNPWKPVLSARPTESRVLPYILVVDDFPDGREVLAEYLQLRGFSVAIAGDGQEALDLAFATTPALILMDLAMPGMDGWEATRTLKADPRTKDVLIIVVTARTMGTEEARTVAAGADGFVVKPFDLARFTDVIADIMARGRPALEGLQTLSPSALPGELI